MGATDMPASGSRPLYHQSTNIAARVTGGRKTIGLPPMNQKNFVSALGSLQNVLRNVNVDRQPAAHGQRIVGLKLSRLRH